MTTTAVLEAKTADFDVDDVEYLRHGDKPLLARVYKPRGEGPFPAMVECHGGAWCQSDRLTEKLRHESMASHGIVSIALDFRSGNEDPYPASVQDINYAVRWAKLNAGALKTRPDLVGMSGQSSGGHLAMLVAMRPHDPRYAAIPLPAGLARARRQRALRGHVVAGDQSAEPLPPCQARARGREPARMAEVDHGAAGFLLAARSQHGGGQPDARARARREGPDAAGGLVPGPRRHHARLQGRGVELSTATSRSASVANYSKAGGSISLEYIGMSRGSRPCAGPVEDRRHVRPDGGLRRQARERLIAPCPHDLCWGRATKGECEFAEVARLPRCCRTA